MLRYLVDVLPVMVTPRWVTTRCQPIAISRHPRSTWSRPSTTARSPAGIYEVGGPDVVTYAEMMALYARCAGLARRRLIKVPLLTPGALVPLGRPGDAGTGPSGPGAGREPGQRSRGRRDRRADDLLEPPVGLAEAIQRSLAATRERRGTHLVRRRRPCPFRPVATDPDWSGGTVLTDVARRDQSAAPARTFVIGGSAIGGDKGWYSSRRLWQIRESSTSSSGGPGLRRGRRGPIASVSGTRSTSGGSRR